MSSVKFRNFFIRYSRVLILVILCAVFALTTKTFWTLSTLSLFVLKPAPVSIILAIVMTQRLILGGIDLSMGSAVAMLSSIMGMTLQATFRTFPNLSPWLGIAVALGLGACIGLANGFLIAKVKIPTFIATYSLQWILKGIALILLGGKQIFDLGTNFRNMFIGWDGTLFAIAAVVALVMNFVLKKTIFGHQVYATGTNQAAAKLSGIRTERIIMTVFLINGLLVGLATIMNTAYVGTAEPITGDSFPLNAVAATLIGGTSIGTVNGKVSNAIVGVLIFLVLTNGMVMIGIPAVWQQCVIGAVIIAAVVLERGMEKISVETV